MFKRTKFAIKDGQFFFCGQPYELTSSVSRGIPAFPVDLILQHELVKLKILLIRGMCPLRSADFDRLLMPVIRSLVQHVHLLPATNAHYSGVKNKRMLREEDGNTSKVQDQYSYGQDFFCLS